mgnify:CR=1 FL=1
MRSRFPHGGEVLGAAPANPILAPVLSQDRGLRMSRQRDLLDLQAIRRISGLVGYWKADPQYLFEDSAGTTPASTSGTGPVGRWVAVNFTPVHTSVTVTNPGFDTDSDWAKGTGWSIGSGVASHETGSVGILSQVVSLTAGKQYLLTWTMTASAGDVTPRFSGGTLVSGTAISVSGTYEENLVAATGNTTLEFRGGSTFVGTIDNVSLIEVSGFVALEATTANKPILRKTPTTGIYWADSNTPTSALNVALSDTVLGRRNLLTYSEDFSNAAWTKAWCSWSSGVVTLTGSGDSIRENITVSANSTVTLKARFVAGTSQWMRMVVYQTSATTNRVSLWFRLDTGELGSVASGGTGSGAVGTITSLGNGGYDLTLTGSINNNATDATIWIGSVSGDGSSSSSNTGLSYGLTRSQLELGSVATDYQKITNVPAYCTLARATAEGVTFTDNAEISPTYNIAPAFGFNSDVAIFNRTLTATEKALITRYMQRAVPLLGSNLVTNGTFDTDLTGWSQIGGGTGVSWTWENGRAHVISPSGIGWTSLAQSLLSAGTWYFTQVEIEITSGIACLNMGSSDPLSSYRQYSSSGSYKSVLSRTGSDATLYLSKYGAGNNFNVIWDNVSVRKIL